MRRPIGLVLISLVGCQMLLALPAFAANIYVPSGAITTIQGGIDAASSGDTVIVRIGVYPGGINFKGKLITVRSENGPQTCTIDGGGNTRGVTFAGGETAQAALEGFTITNCQAQRGGGIECEASSPRIIQCNISRNTAELGGGMYCSNSSPELSRCAILQNFSTSGGGLFLDGSSSPVISNCILRWNSADPGAGGGIYCARSSSPTIVNCTICNNVASSHAGGICGDYASPRIINSILWRDSPRELWFWGGSPVVSHCDVEEAHSGEGNISADPLFVSSRDLHLQGRSPCIDAGTLAGAPPDDFDGHTRPHGFAFDIGAYEYGSDSVIYVGPSEPYTTIQQGIDAAKSGETVIVRDGTYPAGVNFHGKLITLRSQNGPETCIIDGGFSSPGVIFTNGETAQAILEGFTIRNCKSDFGGAISCAFSSPTIRKCIVSGNTATAHGGAMFLDRSSPGLINCIIKGNTAADKGAALYCSSSSPTIVNCTLSGNSAGYYGGGIYGYYSSPGIINSILWQDSPQEIYLWNGTGSPVVSYCDVQGGYPGDRNINFDPLFAGDFQLSPGSPCIDSGNNAAAPATDIDGIARPQDGNGDGIAIADMGAYEMIGTFALLGSLIMDPSDPQYLPDEAFRNPNNRTALRNKIEVVLQMIARGDYRQALDELQNDILKKVDGCAASGAPDKDDWIVDCTYQGIVYQRVTRAIEALEVIIANN